MNNSFAQYIRFIVKTLCLWLVSIFVVNFTRKPVTPVGVTLQEGEGCGCGSECGCNNGCGCA